MEKIKDLVSVNHQAALIRGVQLDWYGDPRFSAENERLVCGYIFSSGVASRDSLTAINIFERLKNTLDQSDHHNVFTIVAQYGHGKSHLALVLANYFGRMFDDPIVDTIVNQIEASTDNQTAHIFKTFKSQSRRPQLVIRLSGHEFTNLRQGFMKALRRALDENPQSRDYEINATSVSAAKWLRSLDGTKRVEATSILNEQFDLDLNELIRSLEEFDSSKVSVARALSVKLNGVAADFGADLNLKDVIDGVITNLCLSDRAPYDKMLVLFDELGIYAEKWCYDRMAAGDLAPQQLLEACDSHKGQICLVAFIQREILEAVKEYRTQDDLRKWAERFPPETRFRLESSLEQVIKGLLSKNQHEWKSFARSNMPRLEKESQTAWNVLPTYQKNPQQWSTSKFTNIVGVGAFPLHPITTGMICNLTFTQGARTIIEVVDTVVTAKNEELALLPGGQLNFVLPTFLVDEFSVNFEGHESRFELYVHAKEKLGSNSPEKFYEVLKALFIFEVGGLKRSENQSHAHVLALLCGYPEAVVADALRELEQEYGIIRFIQVRREFEFSGVGVSRSDVREHVRKQVAGQKIVSLAAKIESLKLLDDVSLPDSEAIKFKTEHGIGGKEWHLKPRLLDASKLEAPHVKRMAEETIAADEARGTVIYVVSSESSELEEAKERAESILDELLATANYLYPVVVAIPSTPSSELEQELLINDALRNVNQSQREFYGEAYKDAVNDSKRRLNDFVASNVRYEDISYFVGATVRETFRGVDADHLDQIASRVFERSFPYRVPAMSDLMRLNSNPGNVAVGEVARYLLKNDGDFGVLSTPARNLAMAVLHEGVDKWGVLNVRNRLHEPTDDRVVRSWQELDRAVFEDRPTDFKSLNFLLQSMPFGHDDYTLTLLYAAWIGLKKNELRFFGVLGGRNEAPKPLSLIEFQGKITKAKEFVKWLEDGKAQIQRPGKLSKTKGTEYLRQLEAVCDYSDAKLLLKKVEDIANGLAPSDPIRTAIIEQGKRLVAEIKKIRDFEQEVTQNNKFVEANISVRKLLYALLTYPQKPDTFLNFDESFHVEGERRLNSRLEAEVARLTLKPLGRIEQYEAVKISFREMRDALKQSGRHDLELLAIEALKNVEVEYKDLIARGKETTILADIESFDAKNANLLGCRRHAERLGEMLITTLANSTETVRQRVNRNLELTNERIAFLEKWLTSLADRVRAADNLSELGNLRDEISRHERDYSQTTEFEALSLLKCQVENSQAVYHEEAASEALRQAKIDEHLRIIVEGVARVLRMESFELAFAELNELRDKSINSGDLKLNELQQTKVDSEVQSASERVNALYTNLLQLPKLQNERIYISHDSELERAIKALDGSAQGPNGWRQALMETRRRLESNLIEYRAGQSRLAEEAERTRAEKIREAENRRLVDDLLRHTKNVGSLRETRNAIQSIAVARERLILPADEEVKALLEEEERLLSNETNLREWVSETLPSELIKAIGLKDVQSLRQRVVNHEAVCSGETLLEEALRQARIALDSRIELINRLSAIDRQTPNLKQSDELFTQFVDLKKDYPEMIVHVDTAEKQFRGRIEGLRKAERRKTDEWLKQFRLVEGGEITPAQARDLLRRLDQGPSNLETRDEEFLALVEEKLEAIRDRDVANRIIDDFTKLHTSQQRADCLLDLVASLKANELLSEHIDLLISILEQQRKS